MYPVQNEFSLGKEFFTCVFLSRRTLWFPCEMESCSPRMSIAPMSVTLSPPLYSVCPTTKNVPSSKTPLSICYGLHKQAMRWSFRIAEAVLLQRGNSTRFFKKGQMVLIQLHGLPVNPGLMARLEPLVNRTMELRNGRLLFNPPRHSLRWLLVSRLLTITKARCTGGEPCNWGLTSTGL